MTYQQAVERARKLFQETREIQFVLWQAGEYHVASQFRLNAGFIGPNDINILYCTAESTIC